MSRYRMRYGEHDSSAVTETYDDVEIEREDGWIVFFRGDDAILRVQESHVRQLEKLTG